MTRALTGSIITDSKLMAASLHPITKAHVHNGEGEEGNGHPNPQQILHHFLPLLELDHHCHVQPVL